MNDMAFPIKQLGGEDYVPRRIMEVMSNTTASNRDTAIKELTRSYEIAMKIEPLLPLVPLGEEQSALADRLLEQVLEALTAALSALMSTNSAPAFAGPATAGPSLTSASDAVSEVLDQVNTPTSRCRGKRSCRDGLRTMTPWTQAPLYDPYQWRQYGEKEIKKPKLLRTYYRCSYKDGGCEATKQIDRKDNSGPPLYQVTYFKQHTCQVEPSNRWVTLDPAMTKPGVFNFGSNVTNSSDQQYNQSTSLASEQQGCELTAINQQKEVLPSSNCTAALVETVVETTEVVEGEHLEVAAHSGMVNMQPSACQSPTWVDMVMEYLVKDSLGGAAEGFFGF